MGGGGGGGRIKWEGWREWVEGEIGRRREKIAGGIKCKKEEKERKSNNR